MHRFLGIFLMGLLAFGVAHAEDFSKLSNKELLKKAGTQPSDEALDYYKEVVKRSKALKSSKSRRAFWVEFEKNSKANLAKMSADDFNTLREEVRADLQEAKKEHSPAELKAMGLDAEVCKGKERKIWCKTKKKGKHHGKGHHKEHHGKEGTHKQAGEHKAGEHKQEKTTAPQGAPKEQGGAHEAPKPAEHQE